MKINNSTKGFLAALLLTSPLVIAEPKYPEAFEPQVIYRDADLISKHGQPATPPASTPVEHTTSKSKYPEGFEPQVLYRDADLIAKNNKQVTVKAEPPVLTSEKTTPNITEKSTKVEKPMTENLPIIFIILGLAGFIFWNMKRSKSSEVTPIAQTKTSETAAVRVPGETGVARYLNNLPAAAIETGVSKYLKSLPAVTAVETGVAKYLKSIPAPTVVVAVAEAGPARETGVAKYLKNLG